MSQQSQTNIARASMATILLIGITACAADDGGPNDALSADLDLADREGRIYADDLDQPGPIDSFQGPEDDDIWSENGSTSSSSSKGVEADFDGDGYTDLAIGVPGEGLSGSLPSAGAVNVIYGSSKGLTAKGDQYWTQDSSGIEGLAEPDDNFGWALAAGDFDDDGYADLAIGVPYESVNGEQRAGGVNVIYGSSKGLRSSGNQFWSQDSSGVEDESEFNDMMGSSLTTGDFDGDGYADLAIGVPYEQVDGRSNAGAVNVIYGSSRGLTSKDDQFWHQDKPGVRGTAQTNDRFGSALAAGNFDGDEYDDLAIGVPLEDLEGVVDGGLVNVLYGTKSGLSADDDQTWHQDTSGISSKAEDFEEFGAALAVGDFDDDGNDDLAIGVPYDDVGKEDDAGGVNVIYGDKKGLDADGEQYFSQDKSGVDGIAESFDQFGWALAAADFDGDDYDDLAIGVPGEDLKDGSKVLLDAGAVNLLYGSKSGVSTKDNQLITQATPGVEGIVENFDGFGMALTTGDYDGDDRADLAVCAPYEDVGDKVDAGAVNLIYGTKSGLKGDDGQLWHQDVSGIEGDAEVDDRFGSAAR
jgi:hypothetical protein